MFCFIPVFKRISIIPTLIHIIFCMWLISARWMIIAISLVCCDRSCLGYLKICFGPSAEDSVFIYSNDVSSSVVCVSCMRSMSILFREIISIAMYMESLVLSVSTFIDAICKVPFLGVYLKYVRCRLFIL